MRLLEQLVVAKRLRLAQHDRHPSLVGAAVCHLQRWPAWDVEAPEGTGHDRRGGVSQILVVSRRLPASAQSQALCAMVCLYGKVLADVIPQGHLGKLLLQRSRRLKRIPAVPSAGEARRAIDTLPAESIGEGSNGPQNGR